MRIIVSGKNDGATNMATDEAILQAYKEGKAPATLRIYGWDPACISIGRFQKVDDVINIVNTTVQFEIHRDIAAYINILSYINQKNNLALRLDEKAGYYLEIGASTPTTITMINNGLSRTSAIILKKYLRSDIREYKTIQKELLPHKDEIEKELPSFMIEDLFV